MGVEVLREKPRGERHRALMSFEEESALLAQFDERAGAGSILVIAEVRLAFEKQLGKKIAKSTVCRILHRNGWRKLVPRPFHPKRKPEVAEAFKKGPRKNRQPSPNPRRGARVPAEDPVPGRSPLRPDERSQSLLGAATDSPSGRAQLVREFLYVFGAVSPLND